MKKELLITLFLALFFVLSTSVYSENTDIYCHVTLVDKDVYILKADKSEAEKAVVNYPLLSGDTIYSNGNAKCEIQFGNGTIIRLDKHTELRLSTLLSPSLTSNKKITTLHLNKGHIYTMNQVYGREIFQIITPTASLKMYRRSTNSILVNIDGATHLFVERGKVGVLYDGNVKALKQVNIKAKEGCWIRDGQKLIRDNQRQNLDFILWNEYVNRNFKKLHHGISKIPRVIYRRSPGIVHFAERFSTKFGSWEYHELFGYVWKPGDFVFHDKRPFWDANYVKIKGELFIIPNQPWGWAPAHLGTWFWSKTHGWIWIPGDAFSPGICSIGLINWTSNYFTGSGDPLYMPQIIDLIDNIYGSFYLYELYRIRGTRAWRHAYERKFGQKPPYKKPYLKNLPPNLVDIIKRVNRTPVQKVVKYLKTNSTTTRTPFKPVQITMLQNRVIKKELPAELKQNLKNREKMGKIPTQRLLRVSRDWNPDSKWARKTGIKLFYSLKKNQVICPRLKLNSRKVTSFQKGYLKRSVIYRGHGLPGNSGIYSNPAGSTQPPMVPGSSGTGINGPPAKSTGSSSANQGSSAAKSK